MTYGICTIKERAEEANQNKTRREDRDPHLETNLISAQETVQDFNALYGDGKKLDYEGY